MIVCKDGCFALHTVYTNCQLRAGLPAIRGAHGATAHNARSHGKCACYPTWKMRMLSDLENAHAIRRGLTRDAGCGKMIRYIKNRG